MKPQHFLSLVLFIFAAFAAGSTALARGEPVIAPEVGRLIKAQGIDAAKARFEELAKSDSLNAGTEISGLHTLMGAYMQAGNHEAAEAVAKMASQLTQSMVYGGTGQSGPGMSGPGMGMPGMGIPGMGMNFQELQKADQAAKEQKKRERQEAQKLAQAKLAKARGNSRDDLDRFSGLYGEKGSSNMGKTIFVMPSCDGYLVAGPMWADVSPWWLRSASDMVFTYKDSRQSFSMTFKLDENKATHVMNHGVDGIGNPLEWKQEMPRGWGKCMERPRR